MKQYIDLCKQVLEQGTWKDAARPGMPRTKSINSVMVKYDLADGFPLLTTKKMYTKGIFTELLWLLRGETNIHYLLKHNCHVWDGDGYKYYCKHHPEDCLPKEKWLEFCTKSEVPEGDMGHIYGYQWRKLPALDQVLYLIENIRNNPNSRYHILESWNVEDVVTCNAALPPCHKQMQFFVRGEYLDMMFFVRSNDLPLGNPWNVPCYATILLLFSHILGYKPGILTYIGGDVHIYENQIEMIEEQIKREPRPLPVLEMHVPGPNQFWYMGNDEKWHFRLDAFLSHIEPTDFEVKNYDPWPSIKIPLSVGL